MKKYVGLSLILFVLTAGMAWAVQANDNSQADENSPIITVDTIHGVKKTVFIHFKESTNNIKPGKPGGSGPACYKTFGREPGPVSYILNPNPDVATTFTEDTILTSAQTWDSATTAQLISTPRVDFSAQSGIKDDKNVIDFGPLSYKNAIAVTYTWTNITTGNISEFDMRFNTKYLWGNATVSGSSVMDLQDIATHEFGHVFGLGDIYSGACRPVTMYGYSSYGETYKRDLAQPDINGLLTLYGP